MSKSSKTDGQELLNNAYELNTPDDNVAYYQEMAASYDENFANVLGYIYPKLIAEAYHNQAGVADLPVADIGCGTGLVAEALDLNPDQTDGFDISPEMLAIAENKNIYRETIQADLTGPLTKFATRYGAILSAGTFTHGHLGPEPLANLLTMAKADALFVIGVNKAHFVSRGFQPVLDRLKDEVKIQQLEITECPIYDKQEHEHGDDRALILTFRKSQ